MIGEVAVGDADAGGAFDGVNEAIGAVLHGDMIDPDILRPEDGDAVAVADGAEAVVVDGVPNHAAVLADDVVEPEAVDDYVADELDGDPGAVGDVDADAAAVDGLVALHDQLLLEDDEHVALEDDPQRLLLNHGMAQGSRPRVHQVVVRRVRHHVEGAVLATGGFIAES